MDIFSRFKKGNDPVFGPAVWNVEPYAAPGFVGLINWMNSPELSIDSLRGQVVLVDFWTFGCINCVRTLPHVQSWYDQLMDRGFTVVGIHSPEFNAEKMQENVVHAVKLRKLTYPIAQDNDMLTWRAYSNQCWPAQYLIDKQGMVRRTHFGEGQYDETLWAIQALLNE